MQRAGAEGIRNGAEEQMDMIVQVGGKSVESSVVINVYSR